ncbi:MAG: Mth938-like domain-containing protein [Pseudomonadota bacterium]
MKMTELEFEGAQPPIDSYGAGGFRIAGTFREGSLLLGPQGAGRWSLESFDQLSDGHLGDFDGFSGAVDVILIGAGAELRPLPASLRAQLEAAGFGVETMSTSSACRTYNVLLSEGRRVGAALIAV